MKIRLDKKSNAFAVLICTCLCFFVGISKSAHADSFVVGVEDLNYYPYFDFGPDVDGQSFAKALLDKFAKDNGHKISYLPLPIKQFPKWLYQENIDFKFPDNPRWLVKDSVYKLAITYSDDVLMLNAGTIVLAKNVAKDISEYRNIGTVTGFSPTLWLEKISQNKVTLLEDKSPKILVQNLVNGLIDGLVIDLTVAKNELQNLKLKEELIYSPNIPQETFAYKLSTVKYPQIITQFNQWQLQNGSFIQKLKDKFGILDTKPQASKSLEN